MKRSILLSLLVVAFVISYAKAPDWYDVQNRAAFYPIGAYFCGFAMNEVAKGQSLDDAIESVKAAARVEAVSTIQVQVKSVKQDFSRSDSYTNGSTELADFYQRFEFITTLSTNMDIPGLKVESFRDGNIVAAFAYVKKRDLQRQLDKQITISLARVETQMDYIDELINNGQKTEARKRLAILADDLNNIEKNQELLLAVDPEANVENLQLNEAKALQHRYDKMTAVLKNGIYITLQCDADCFGTSYTTLQNEIKGQLSPIGCSFTDKAMEADWLIVISSKAREYRAESYGSYTSFFVYVDSHIAITNQTTGQKVYEDLISMKGGDTRSNENAARAAYKDTSPQLVEIIKQHILQ